MGVGDDDHIVLYHCNDCRQIRDIFGRVKTLPYKHTPTFIIEPIISNFKKAALLPVEWLFSTSKGGAMGGFSEIRLFFAPEA